MIVYYFVKKRWISSCQNGLKYWLEFYYVVWRTFLILGSNLCALKWVEFLLRKNYDNYNFLFKWQNIVKEATYSWKQHILTSHILAYSHQKSCLVKLVLTEWKYETKNWKTKISVRFTPGLFTPEIMFS